MRGFDIYYMCMCTKTIPDDEGVRGKKKNENENESFGKGSL